LILSSRAYPVIGPSCGKTAALTISRLDYCAS
jgi:hypothetical protein